MTTFIESLEADPYDTLTTEQLEGALKATEARTARLKNMRLSPEKKAKIEQLNAMAHEYLSVAVVSLTSAHTESSRTLASMLDSVNNALEKTSVAAAPATQADLLAPAAATAPVLQVPSSASPPRPEVVGPEQYQVFNTRIEQLEAKNDLLLRDNLELVIRVNKAKADYDALKKTRDFGVTMNKNLQNQYINTLKRVEEQMHHLDGRLTGDATKQLKRRIAPCFRQLEKVITRRLDGVERLVEATASTAHAVGGEADIEASAEPLELDSAGMFQTPARPLTAQRPTQLVTPDQAHDVCNGQTAQRSSPPLLATIDGAREAAYDDGMVIDQVGAGNPVFSELALRAGFAMLDLNGDPEESVTIPDAFELTFTTTNTGNVGVVKRHVLIWLRQWFQQLDDAHGAVMQRDDLWLEEHQMDSGDWGVGKRREQIEEYRKRSEIGWDLPDGSGMCLFGREIGEATTVANRCCGPC
jgi:hypothetical protein